MYDFFNATAPPLEIRVNAWQRSGFREYLKLMGYAVHEVKGFFRSVFKIVGLRLVQWERERENAFVNHYTVLPTVK